MNFLLTVVVCRCGTRTVSVIVATKVLVVLPCYYTLTYGSPRWTHRVILPLSGSMYLLQIFNNSRALLLLVPDVAAATMGERPCFMTQLGKFSGNLSILSGCVTFFTMRALWKCK